MIDKTLSHYRITAKLGAGGMGEVYEAEDTELRRKVALKILPQELAQDPERLERFKREARAVAALNHPNIVTLHSVEEAESQHFLTMELVEGQSFDQLIPDQGFELDRFFELAIPIADALSAAHERGVVHRDLKPANVMLTADGRVKIVDFGLAKLWEKEPADDSTELATEGLTKEGVAMGTAPYMSPEQLQGKEVDHRSDLFSLGILLYEMSTGVRPFKGQSSIDLASSILKDDPDSVTEIREGLPRHLGRIIRHCLEKDPDLRYQSGKDVRNELAGLKGEVESGAVPLSTGAMPAVPPPPTAAAKQRPGWLIPAALAAGALIVVALIWMNRGREAGTVVESIAPSESAVAVEPEFKKIVVLPFENLGAAEDEYFAAGMTEEISARLASVKDLGVISRSSAVQYDRTGKTLMQVGEDLGVGYVLEGTVRWARNPDGSSRVRVTPQLIRVADDTQLWAETYDRTLEDIFEVQTEIAGKVLAELDLALVGGEQMAAVEAPTENLDAYNLYLRALNAAERAEALSREEERLMAVQILEQAVALDPEFAIAWAELSQQHALLYFNGHDRTEERLEAARTAVERALEIDPDLPQGHVAFGRYYYWGPRDYDKALEEFTIAEKDLPNDSELMASIAYIIRRQGRFEEALARQRKALELNPKSVQQSRALGTTYMQLGRYEEADRQLARTIEMAPDYAAAGVWRAWNWLLWKGDGLGAAERIEPYTRLGVDVFKLLRAYYLYLGGRYSEALVEIEGLSEELYSNQFYANPLALNRAYALKALGRPEEARAAASEAVEVLEREVLANPDDPRMHAALGLAYAMVGREEEAVREGERAVKLQPVSVDVLEGSAKLLELGTIHALLGNAEEALEALDRALASNRGMVSIQILEADPIFAGVRQAPGYKDLVEKHP
jgi:non-specific serine/threonine protein kinase